jgi:NADPH:quinone reductase-like Zn-dependent oxidoreductase
MKSLASKHGTRRADGGVGRIAVELTHWRGAKVIGTALTSEETAHAVRAQHFASAPPVGKTLTEVAGLAASGHIKPIVFTVLPLSEIRKAHEMIEGKHTRGKIVLQVVA